LVSEKLFVEVFYEFFDSCKLFHTLDIFSDELKDLKMYGVLDQARKARNLGRKEEKKYNRILEVQKARNDKGLIMEEVFNFLLTEITIDGKSGQVTIVPGDVKSEAIKASRKDIDQKFESMYNSFVAGVAEYQSKLDLYFKPGGLAGCIAAEELEEYMRGSLKIDLDELLGSIVLADKTTTIGGLNSKDALIKVARAWIEPEVREDKAGKLWFFISGSKTAPAGGFKSLKYPITIARSDTPHKPIKAQNCYNTIYIHPYDSFENFEEGFNFAIDHSGSQIAD